MFYYTIVQILFNVTTLYYFFIYNFTFNMLFIYKYFYDYNRQYQPHALSINYIYLYNIY